MIYEYSCRACRTRFEVSATIEEKAAGLAARCPACGSGDTAQAFDSINASRLSSSGKNRGKQVPPCHGPGCGCCGMEG